MQPTNPLVNPMLTDLYQLTMAYGYWRSGRHEDKAVFDLFFRKNPFGGEFTVFAGLEEVLRLVDSFRFTPEQLDYLKAEMPDCKREFFDWLSKIDCSKINLFAVKEGTVVFPRIPLIRAEGPLAIVQMLETPLLNLINYPSLVATNAARFRLAAGPDKTLIEFGLRRAQGPDGAISASRYSYIGGFDATSNVLAGQLFGIPILGTMAHSFISSFSSLDKLDDVSWCNFSEKIHYWQTKLDLNHTNKGELAAFVAYAQAFPKGFLALVDTYDTLRSGIPNFLCVALVLKELGYQPLGIRLDSGDLTHLSQEARKMFRFASEKSGHDLSNLQIAASNDINEKVLHALNEQRHEIDVFGIGTHLVTCQTQPALGCVYKLVEINGWPRIKLSEEPAKVTLPGRKEVYRLIGQEGYPLLDLMVQVGEEPPQAGKEILCRHPFSETKRALVTPSQVVLLHHLVWDGKLTGSLPSIREVRDFVRQQIAMLRPDHLRAVNPTPYKVSVSERLYTFLHELLQTESPIATLQ